MRKLSLAVLLCISTLCAQDNWYCDNHLSILLDYGYIRRQEARNFSFAKGPKKSSNQFHDITNNDNSNSNIDNINVNDNKKSNSFFKSVIDTNDLIKHFDWESAIRGGLTYNADACTSFEALYTYFYPWNAEKVARGNNDLFFPFKFISFGDDYLNASKVTARYESRLQNGEFNYWGHVTPQRVNYYSFSWNLGFRYINLRERLILIYKRENDKSPYKIRTFNDLYGAQLGAMFEMNPNYCWTWTFIVKGAAFFNNAVNKVEIRDQNSQIKLIGTHKNRWTDSYLLEGYGQLAYHWSPNFSLHFGYQGFILTGVVIAPNQRVTSVQSRRIHTGGQILIDGFYAGLDLSF